MPKLDDHFHAQDARLLDSIQRGDLSEAKKALEAGASIDVVTLKNEDTPLLLALSEPRTEKKRLMAQWLIEQGADVSAQARDGTTALHEVSVAEMLAPGSPCEPSNPPSPNLVQMLIDRGASVCATNKSGQTPVELALRRGSPVEWVASLLAAERACALDINRSVPGYAGPGGGSGTLLRVALLFNRPALGLLLSEGAKPCPRALVDAASHYEDPEVIMAPLLAAGGDIHHVDEQGQCLLMHAVYWKRLEMVQWLLDRGLDPNRQDAIGRTALMHAASTYGTQDIIKLLVARGADLLMVDNASKKALDMCHDENYALLVSLVADSIADATPQAQASTALSRL